MVYMYHSFLVHSSADGHLGCFHVLFFSQLFVSFIVSIFVVLWKLTSCWKSIQSSVSIAFLLVIFCIQFASRVCSAVHCSSWYSWMHVHHFVYIFTYLLWFLYFVFPFKFSLDYLNNFRIGYVLSFDFLALTLYIILAFYIYSKYRNSNNIGPFNSPAFCTSWITHVNIQLFINQVFMSLREN